MPDTFLCFCIQQFNQSRSEMPVENNEAKVEQSRNQSRDKENPFVLTVANALTGFFRLPCSRSQSDDFYDARDKRSKSRSCLHDKAFELRTPTSFYYYSTKKAHTFKTEH